MRRIFAHWYEYGTGVEHWVAISTGMMVTPEVLEAMRLWSFDWVQPGECWTL